MLPNHGQFGKRLDPIIELVIDEKIDVDSIQVRKQVTICVVVVAIKIAAIGASAYIGANERPFTLRTTGRIDVKFSAGIGDTQSVEPIRDIAATIRGNIELTAYITDTNTFRQASTKLGAVAKYSIAPGAYYNPFGPCGSPNRIPEADVAGVP